MTLAWYGHLKFLHAAPLWKAILFGWCIALLEYSFMIPATRLLAQQGFSMGEMKISQEVVTLLVLCPSCCFYLNNLLSWIIYGRVAVCSAVCILYFGVNKSEILRQVMSIFGEDEKTSYTSVP